CTSKSPLRVLINLVFAQRTRKKAKKFFLHIFYNLLQIFFMSKNIRILTFFISQKLDVLRYFQGQHRNLQTKLHKYHQISPSIHFFNSLLSVSVIYEKILNFRYDFFLSKWFCSLNSPPNT